MDRTLTKILLARTKTEVDSWHLPDVVSDDQFGRWTTATVTICACVDSEPNSPSPRCNAMTSSPQRAADRKNTGVVLNSCAAYADIFGKNCVDGDNFRYIPHNRMYIKCKTAARVRLADKRRKYGLGRQTARRTITKATVKQPNVTTDNRSQRYRLLPPLKQQETAPIKEETRKKSHVNDVTGKTATKSRDRDVTGKMATNATKSEQHRSTSSVDEDDSDDNESDDDDDDRYEDRHNMNIHEGHRRYHAYDSGSSKDNFSSSDESYSRPSRDRRHGDYKSSHNSVSVNANKLLKTSSYKFITPGSDVPFTKQTSGYSLRRGRHITLMSSEDRSSTAYFSDDLTINTKHGKTNIQRRRRESRDSDSDYDIDHRKFNAKDRRRSRSASPDWNSSRSSNLSGSRSELSREQSDEETAEWPINHTKTCLLPDCRKCRDARRVTGSSKSKDHRVVVTEVTEVTRARRKTDAAADRDLTSNNPFKLNLIGQTISVGPGHRTASLKTR